ncbi:MAG: dihydrofolate reductase family protein [Pyrinomonadaceae bacterium]
MRKVLFGGAISLDNFIARPDGAVDWLQWSDEAAAYLKELWSSVDAMLMGRMTYENALKQGAGGGHPAICSYVCSRTMTPRKQKNGSEVVNDAVGLVTKLKQKDGRDIYLLGGGLLAASLFEADLVDEIGFSIQPVLLGQGIPLYHPTSKQIELELISADAWKNGCVLVKYRVRK